MQLTGVTHNNLIEPWRDLFEAVMLNEDPARQLHEIEIRWLVTLATWVGGDFAEIGCCQGASTRVFAENLPHSMIYAVDWTLATPPQQTHETPTWETLCLHARGLSNVIVVHGDSKWVNLPTSVRTVLIDAGHTLDAVWADTSRVMAVVQCGVIAWHDYGRPYKWIGVKRCVDSLDGQGFMVLGTTLCFTVRQLDTRDLILC